MRFLKNKISQANSSKQKKSHASATPDDFQDIKQEEGIKEEDLSLPEQTLTHSPNDNIKIEEKIEDGAKIEEDLPNGYQITSLTSNSTKESTEQSEQPQRRQNRKDSNEFSKRETKNIAIHYGKAITSFATSYMAIPYIKDQITKNHFIFSDFINFVNKSKSKIKSMNGLRSILLVEEKDDSLTATYKKVLQYISEIFIKYFSVNWIVHSKLAHKMTYLKYRFKMLRRIQDPEHFTYIKPCKHEQTND